MSFYLSDNDGFDAPPSKDPVPIGQLIGDLFSPPLDQALAPDPKVVTCRRCKQHFKSEAQWLFKGWHYANTCPRCAQYGRYAPVIAKCVKPPPKHYRCSACDSPVTVAPEFELGAWLYWGECPCGNRWCDFMPLRAICRECTKSFIMTPLSLDLVCRDCREKSSDAKRSDKGESYE